MTAALYVDKSTENSEASGRRERREKKREKGQKKSNEGGKRKKERETAFEAVVIMVWHWIVEKKVGRRKR